MIIFFGLTNNKQSVQITNYWIDRLTVSSVWKLYITGQLGSTVYYLQLSTAARLFIAFLPKRGQWQQVHYEFGDQRDPSGRSWSWTAYQMASEFSIEICEHMLKDLDVFKALAPINPEKVKLQVEMDLRSLFLPLMRFICLVKWSVAHSALTGPNLILWPDNTMIDILQNHWRDQTIRLMGYSHFFKDEILYKIKEKLKLLGRVFIRLLLPNQNPSKQTRPMIAVHYAEGFDPRRRSDLRWFDGSGIDPKQVVVCIDLNKNKKHPVSCSELESLHRQGFVWSCMDRRSIENQRWKIWRPRYMALHDQKQRLYKMRSHKEMQSKERQWLIGALCSFLERVELWVEFFSDYYVKIYYDTSEMKLCQSAALDITGGVCLGKQRSEHYWSTIYDHGSHHCDVLFAWNRRHSSWLCLDRSRIKTCIVTGHPDDIALRHLPDDDLHLANLRENGVQFVVALFDNVYGQILHFSEKMMLSFYSSFLEWAICDPTVGIILKPKKPAFLSGLVGLKPILEKTINTGRCIILSDSLRRLPSDAAHYADISIGVGISSAVIEAVIGGAKGIHCDLSKIHGHLFYKWGKDKIIFDDVEKLVAALKRYKDDKSSVPGLGDWSEYIVQLDSYSDGRAFNRIGLYISWLLQSFEHGKTPNEAIEYANSRFASRYGKKNIIQMAPPC